MALYYADREADHDGGEFGDGRHGRARNSLFFTAHGLSGVGVIWLSAGMAGNAAADRRKPRNPRLPGGRSGFFALRD
jgi:hypothetical protein